MVVSADIGFVIIFALFRYEVDHCSHIRASVPAIQKEQ